VDLPATSKNTLPKVLMVDKFHSHTSTEDKMSFICADGETGKLVNFLPSRKLSTLTAHFQKFSNPSEVAFLVTDMNTAYFQLTKSVFPQAKLVIDWFHIIKHLNKALQDFRVREMKRLIGSHQREGYQKLKANWRMLTKNRQTINHTEYKTWLRFPTPKYPYLTRNHGR
jgi:transposase